jgi:N-acetylmuramoyl-L-alanine amidase
MKNYSGRIVQSIALGVILGLLTYKPLTEAHLHRYEHKEEVKTETTRVELGQIVGSEPIPGRTRLIQVPVESYTSPDNIIEEMYYDSLELLACCVEAEAGNQSEYGKRLVCDVVLNRVDDQSGLFPNNIWDVIFQRYQFTPVLDGRIYQVDPTEETFRVVSEELQSRTNYRVMFFT